MLLVKEVGMSLSDLRELTDREVQRWMVYHDEHEDMKQDATEDEIREVRRKAGNLGDE